MLSTVFNAFVRRNWAHVSEPSRTSSQQARAVTIWPARAAIATSDDGAALVVASTPLDPAAR
jgi:hypothetical protein